MKKRISDATKGTLPEAAGKAPPKTSGSAATASKTSPTAAKPKVDTEPTEAAEAPSKVTKKTKPDKTTTAKTPQQPAKTPAAGKTSPQAGKGPTAEAATPQADKTTKSTATTLKDDKTQTATAPPPTAGSTGKPAATAAPAAGQPTHKGEVPNAAEQARIDDLVNRSKSLRPDSPPEVLDKWSKEYQALKAQLQAKYGPPAGWDGYKPYWTPAESSTPPGSTGAAGTTTPTSAASPGTIAQTPSGSTPAPAWGPQGPLGSPPGSPSAFSLPSPDLPTGRDPLAWWGRHGPPTEAQPPADMDGLRPEDGLIYELTRELKSARAQLASYLESRSALRAMATAMGLRDPEEERLRMLVSTGERRVDEWRAHAF